jgi:hypothetical protein
MTQAVDIAYTAGEIRSLLENVPDHMPVEFSPITMAWLGGSEPLRVHKDCGIFTSKGDEGTVEQPDTHLVIYLHEFE